MSGSGIYGVREALKAQQQLIGIEASNLNRSLIPGAKELRGTLTGFDAVDLGQGRQYAGPGVSLSATTSDFSQGSITRTGFTTDLAISGEGFFVLMDAANNLYYTRRGDFHFDSSGSLVNNNGLWVASFDPKTNALEHTTIKVNPVTDDLGDRVLAELETNGDQTSADIATALGELQVDIDSKLAELKVAGYATEYFDAPDTKFASNLGQLGDQVMFDRDGILINQTRGLKRGNQIALAIFPNNQGLVPGTFGGEVFKSTDAAVAGGIPEFGVPGDVSMGLGSIESQALEQSTSSITSASPNLGLLQRNFTATAAAMKIFLSAWDDLNSVLRGA